MPAKTHQTQSHSLQLYYSLRNNLRRKIITENTYKTVTDNILECQCLDDNCAPA